MRTPIDISEITTQFKPVLINNPITNNSKVIVTHARSKKSDILALVNEFFSDDFHFSFAVKSSLNQLNIPAIIFNSASSSDNALINFGFSRIHNLAFKTNLIFYPSIFKKNIDKFQFYLSLSKISPIQFDENKLQDDERNQAKADFFALFIMLSEIGSQEDMKSFIRSYLAIRSNENLSPFGPTVVGYSKITAEFMLDNLDNIDMNSSYEEIDKMAFEFIRDV